MFDDDIHGGLAQAIVAICSDTFYEAFDEVIAHPLAHFLAKAAHSHLVPPRHRLQHPLAACRRATPHDDVRDFALLARAIHHIVDLTVCQVPDALHDLDGGQLFLGDKPDDLFGVRVAFHSSPPTKPLTSRAHKTTLARLWSAFEKT